MRRTILFAILVLFSLMTVPTQAQAPKCDPAAVIKLANGLKSAKSAQKDMAALMKLQDSITAAHIACNGLTFKGTGEKVSKPFIIPKGLYKVTATSDGFLIVDLRSLTGSDCQPDAQVGLFNLDRDQAKVGGETTLPVPGDCRVIMSTSNTRTTWTITFEPIE